MNNKRLENIIVYNAMATRFNMSLAGASIWTLIGMMQVPIYATILKISDMASSIISGKMQKRFAHMNRCELMNLSFRFDLMRTILYSLGNMIIVFNFHLGVALLIASSALYGVADATQVIQRDRIAETLYPDQKARGVYRGHLKMMGATAHTLGLGINLIVMAISVALSVNQEDMLKYIIFLHGIFSIIDFIISMIEKKELVKFYKELESKEEL